MIPTVIIVALGVDPMNTLVISQVILSLVLPIPILSLIYFTRRKDLMGVLVNKPIVNGLGIIFSAIIVLLNLWLIVEVIF